MKTRVVVADRNNLVCEAMCAMLKAFETIEVVGSATGCETMLELVRTLSPSVIVMDMAISPLDVEETIRHIRQIDNNIRVLLISQYEDKEGILKALKAGGNGYLPKRAKAAELMTAITALSQGGYFLYPSVAKQLVGEYLSLGKKQKTGGAELDQKETEVMKLILAGEPNRVIAEKLGVKPGAVLRHRANIMTKIGVHNQTELIKYAIRKHMVELEE